MFHENKKNIYRYMFTNILDTLAPVVEIRVKQRTVSFIQNQEDNKHLCKLKNLVQREVQKAKSLHF